MPDLSYFTALFHRAAKGEEIGILIRFEREIPDGFIQDNFNASRPEGFEDYTVVLASIPNTIFIVKPGVRLD